MDIAVPAYTKPLAQMISEDTTSEAYSENPHTNLQPKRTLDFTRCKTLNQDINNTAVADPWKQIQGSLVG